MATVIITEVFPPIPTREFDYQATYDGDEPNDNGSMDVGHGRTASDALLDLLENYPRKFVALFVKVAGRKMAEDPHTQVSMLEARRELGEDGEPLYTNANLEKRITELYREIDVMRNA